MKELLVEKYRPKSINEYVFQNEEIERAVSKWIKEKSIPNLLLAGNPGTGKSSLARILIKELDIEESDVKTINGSLTTGIGFIREELEPWMKKTSFSPFKVVLIEEGERLSKNAQDSLKAIIEDYCDDVRFIMTTNNAAGVVEALHSRFQIISMGDINMDGILDMVVDIIEKEDIQVIDENDLMSHIDAFAPDIRKIIQSIDKHTDEAKLLYTLQNVVRSATADDWAKAWSNGDTSLKTLLPLTEGVDSNNFEFFYETIYENAQKSSDLDTGLVIMLCSQYLDRAYRCSNQRLHLDAFLYHIHSDE